MDQTTPRVFLLNYPWLWGNSHLHHGGVINRLRKTFSVDQMSSMIQSFRAEEVSHIIKDLVVIHQWCVGKLANEPSPVSSIDEKCSQELLVRMNHFQYGVTSLIPFKALRKSKSEGYDTAAGDYFGTYLDVILSIFSDYETMFENVVYRELRFKH